MQSESFLITFKASNNPKRLFNPLTPQMHPNNPKRLFNPLTL